VDATSVASRHAALRNAAVADGLFCADDRLLLLLAHKPSPRGGLQWLVFPIDPSQDAIGKPIELPTTAAEIVFVPGQKRWAVLEKGAMKYVGVQPLTRIISFSRPMLTHEGENGAMSSRQRWCGFSRRSRCCPVAARSDRTSPIQSHAHSRRSLIASLSSSCRSYRMQLLRSDDLRCDLGMAGCARLRNGRRDCDSGSRTTERSVAAVRSCVSSEIGGTKEIALPRVEIRCGRHLLLSRSVPSNGIQAELLTERCSRRDPYGARCGRIRSRTALNENRRSRSCLLIAIPLLQV
jgi:hypothetical protein